jgi:hypothetical protein
MAEFLYDIFYYREKAHQLWLVEKPKRKKYERLAKERWREIKELKAKIASIEKEAGLINA